MRKTAWTIAAAAALLSGVALAAGGDDASRAEAVADLLVAADRASAQADNGSRKRLAAAVETLDRIGVQSDPVDADGAAVLANWRQQARVEQPVERGRVLGPAFRRGFLDPGGALTVEQLFLAGQSASVAVAAAPGKGIALAVSGPDAQAACERPGRACRWTPLFTQRYAITVRNGGAARVRYYLVMD